MVKYWLQTLKTENWEKIKSLFIKEKLNIYSYNHINVSSDDIFIIYHCEKQTKNNGFVSYGKFNSEIKLNENNDKRIFNDLGISKYKSSLKNVHIFNEDCKLNDVYNLIEKINGLKKIDQFKKKYTTITSTFLELSEELGKVLIGYFYKLQKQSFESYNNSDYDQNYDYEIKSDKSNKSDKPNETDKIPKQNINKENNNSEKKKRIRFIWCRI